MGNEPPPEDLSPWLPRNGHDLFVVGVQVGQGRVCARRIEQILSFGDKLPQMPLGFPLASTDTDKADKNRQKHTDTDIYIYIYIYTHTIYMIYTSI
jgi:hypothetical protein